jgi:hypothetical protein
MNVLILKRSKYVQSIVLFTSAFLVLLIAFYIFSIMPRQVYVSQFNTFERDILTKKSVLSENRTLTDQYIGLDPTLATFESDKTKILEKLVNSNDKLSKTFVESGPIKPPFFANNKLKEFIRNISGSEIRLAEDVKSFIGIQDSVLNKLTNINELIGKIYGYDPATEFSLYSFPDSNEDVNEAVAVISAGIKNLRDQSKNLNSQTMVYKEFDSQIAIVLADLEIIGNLVKTNAENDVIQASVNDFNRSYRKLKFDTFAIELEVFKSDEVLKMLADEANVIDGYNALLEQIADFKKESLEN